MSPADKRRAFRALHQSGCFVIPNPWNVGSARYLQGLGFKALATTARALPMRKVTPTARNRANRCSRISLRSPRRPTCRSTPISRTAMPTTRPAGRERDALRRDRRRRPVDRGRHRRRRRSALRLRSSRSRACKAARAAIDKAGGDVMFTARTEGFIQATARLDETIRRLKAFADAGADCLYSPGIKTREQIEATVKAVAPKPINFLNSRRRSVSPSRTSPTWACAASASAARWRASPCTPSSAPRPKSPRKESSTASPDVITNAELNAFFHDDRADRTNPK